MRVMSAPGTHRASRSGPRRAACPSAGPPGVELHDLRLVAPVGIGVGDHVRRLAEVDLATRVDSSPGATMLGACRRRSARSRAPRARSSCCATRSAAMRRSPSSCSSATAASPSRRDRVPGRRAGCVGRRCPGASLPTGQALGAAGGGRPSARRGRLLGRRGARAVRGGRHPPRRARRSRARRTALPRPGGAPSPPPRRRALRPGSLLGRAPARDRPALYFARWITPAANPRRWDTRFLIGRLPTVRSPSRDGHRDG